MGNRLSRSQGNAEAVVTHAKVLAQLVTERQRIHPSRLCGILDLQPMLVRASDVVDASIRVGDPGMARKDVRND